MAKNKIEFLGGKVSMPEIIIPYNIAVDISAIVSSKTGEIGWIGEAEEVEKNVFRINKVTVPLQDANGSTTEINAQGIVDIMKDEPDFDFDSFRYWGHSHGTMSTFASPQDKTMMKEFAESCEWFIGTIHNNRGEVYAYIVDNRKGVYIEDILVKIENPDIEPSRDWKKISKERVKFKTFAGTAHGKYKGGKNYWNGNSLLYDDVTVVDKQIKTPIDIVKELPESSYKRRKKTKGKNLTVKAIYDKINKERSDKISIKLWRSLLDKVMKIDVKSKTIFLGEKREMIVSFEEWNKYTDHFVDQTLIEMFKHFPTNQLHY